MPDRTPTRCRTPARSLFLAAMLLVATFAVAARLNAQEAAPGLGATGDAMSGGTSNDDASDAGDAMSGRDRGRAMGSTTGAAPGERFAEDTPFGKYFRNVRSIKLNADQLASLDQIERELSAQVVATESLSNDDRLDTIRQVASATRIKVFDLLEPEQRKQLQRATSTYRRPPEQSKTPPVNLATEPTAGPGVGEASPPFVLKGLDAPDFRLDQLKGRVVLLVWGSMSSPTFRDKASDLAAIAGDPKRGLVVCVVYGPEAFPSGVWDIDRNDVDNLHVPAAGDSDQRRTLARRVRDEMKTGATVVMDDDDATFTRAMGAGQNSTVLLNRDGTIAWRQDWFDADGLARHIDTAIAKPLPNPNPAR